MYIKKKDREFFKELDENLVLPAKWKMFIQKETIKNNFIIKNQKIYKCTYCNATFEDDAKIKINDKYKCPNCKNKYQVKSKRLSKYEFKKDLGILQKYNDYYIVRHFRLVSYSNDITKGFESWHFEYARVIYDNKFNLVQKIVNSNMVGTTSGLFPIYREEPSHNWRYYNCWSYAIPDIVIYYSSNLKKIFKNIPGLEYSQIWELVKHVECDIVYLIENYNQSVELLTKMKLYNLALNPRYFKNKKNFEDRFIGLSKDFLPFIIKNNLTLDELTILSIIKVKNMSYINKLRWCYKEQLEKISSRVNLITLLEKTDFDSSKDNLYLDYLEMATKMRMNLKDKKILYPAKIKEAHDKVLKDYKNSEDKIIRNAVKRKGEINTKYSFKDSKYVIFPARDMEALIDESKQQNNCVRTYADAIAADKCDIYFMRLIENKEKSLVTVEVKNNKVVQKRTKNNEITTKNQDAFLRKWEQKILNNKEAI